MRLELLARHPTTSSLLETPIGTSRLLAHSGGQRLCLLNPSAAVLWDLHACGLGAAALVELLTTRFGLTTATARAQVDGLIAAWHQAGLLDAGAGTPERQIGDPVDPASPPPRPIPAPTETWELQIADQTVSFGCDNPCFAQTLEPWLAPLRTEPTAVGPVDHLLRLSGSPSVWRLDLNEVTRTTGNTLDDALVATLKALVDIVCRPAERLIVLHGAGLVAPDGRGLLLIAPGGSGKTTLAAALDTAGYGLLSDDVVPVTPDGKLLGLGLPLCLKSGSWPVLVAHRPDLDQAPVIQRYGQMVRFLPPHTPTPARSVTPARLLLTRYQPGTKPQVTLATPEQALQGILIAETALRDLTQAKLEALAHWVTITPAYTLTYPDLACGLALVQATLMPPYRPLDLPAQRYGPQD